MTESMKFQMKTKRKEKEQSTSSKQQGSQDKTLSQKGRLGTKVSWINT